MMSIQEARVELANKGIHRISLYRVPSAPMTQRTDLQGISPCREEEGDFLLLKARGGDVAAAGVFPEVPSLLAISTQSHA